MQKKAQKQQDKFDEVSSYTDALMAKMKAKVDVVDQPVNQAEIHGLHDQINNALDQVNGDYSKIGGLVKNIAKEFDLYLNTDEGRTMEETKVAIDANRKKLMDSTMDEEDVKLGLATSYDPYANGGGFIGGMVYKPSTTYENPVDLPERMLKHAQALKDKNMGYGSTSTFVTEKGQFVIQNKDYNKKGVTSARILEDFKGIVFGDVLWNDKMQWQYERYGQLGKLPDSVKTLDDYKKLRYEEMMHDSLKYSANAMASDDVEYDVNIRETDAMKRAVAKQEEIEAGIGLEESINLYGGYDVDALSTEDAGIAKWDTYGETKVTGFAASVLKDLGVTSPDNLNKLFEMAGVQFDEEGRPILDEKASQDFLTNFIANPDMINKIAPGNTATAAVRNQMMDKAVALQEGIRKTKRDLLQTTKEYMVSNPSDLEKGDIENYEKYNSYINNANVAIERFLKLPTLTTDDRTLARSVYGGISEIANMSDGDRTKMIASLNKIADRGLEIDNDFMSGDEHTYFTKGLYGENVGIGFSDRVDGAVGSFTESVHRVKNMQRDSKFTEFVSGRVESNKDIHAQQNATNNRDMFLMTDDGVVQRQGILAAELAGLSKSIYQDNANSLLNAKTNTTEGLTVRETLVNRELAARDIDYEEAEPDIIREVTESVEKKVRDSFNQAGKVRKQPLKIIETIGKNNGNIILYDGIPVEMHKGSTLRSPTFGNTFTPDYKSQLILNSKIDAAYGTSLAGKKEIFENVYIDTESTVTDSKNNISTYRYSIKGLDGNEKTVTEKQMKGLALAISNLELQAEQNEGNVIYKGRMMSFARSKKLIINDLHKTLK